MEPSLSLWDSSEIEVPGRRVARRPHGHHVVQRRQRGSQVGAEHLVAELLPPHLDHPGVADVLQRDVLGVGVLHDLPQRPGRPHQVVQHVLGRVLAQQSQAELFGVGEPVLHQVGPAEHQSDPGVRRIGPDGLLGRGDEAVGWREGPQQVRRAFPQRAGESVRRRPGAQCHRLVESAPAVLVVPAERLGEAQLHPVVPLLLVLAQHRARPPQRLGMIVLGQRQVPEGTSRVDELAVAATGHLEVETPRLAYIAAHLAVIAEQQRRAAALRLGREHLRRQLGDPGMRRLCFEELPGQVQVSLDGVVVAGGRAAEVPHRMPRLTRYARS